MKRIVIGEISAGNKFLIAATTVAFFLIMTMPNYSVLAYTNHGGEDKPLNTMYFRILKGDLNVCSPSYQYNITICQMVMKDEELLPFEGENSHRTHTNNATNTSNSTNSSSYPPLSIRPEIVINEEQLQELLTNTSLSTPEGFESLRHNVTGTTHSNDTESEGVGKIYVDEYPQFEPLAIEQPLEEEGTIDNSLQKPWESDQQTLFLNNQTISNGAHDIEEPSLSKDTVTPEDDLLDSMMSNRGSGLGDIIGNTKADTSNSYSSIPTGMSPPLKK